MLDEGILAKQVSYIGVRRDGHNNLDGDYRGWWNIAGALITALFARQEFLRNKSYDKVTGSINEPQPDESVRRIFNCSGVVTGIQHGLNLWLVVEVGDLVWPKENKITPNEEHKWSATVFEDGAAETFALALFVADSNANRRIEDWLETGRSTGTTLN